ncbi:hypothetical protein TNCV_1268711 [Trichonephila clavipes]|nr:hypothetical protein TNCV_1268711 [Trichonephila clavipes]
MKNSNESENLIETEMMRSICFPVKYLGGNDFDGMSTQGIQLLVEEKIDETVLVQMISGILDYLEDDNTDEDEIVKKKVKA